MNHTHFKTISVQSQKPSRKKVEALRKCVEPGYPKNTSDHLIEVAISADFKSVLNF